MGLQTSYAVRKAIKRLREGLREAEIGFNDYTLAYSWGYVGSIARLEDETPLGSANLVDRVWAFHAHDGSDESQRVEVLLDRIGNAATVGAVRKELDECLELSESFARQQQAEAKECVEVAIRELERDWTNPQFLAFERAVQVERNLDEQATSYSSLLKLYENINHYMRVAQYHVLEYLTSSGGRVLGPAEYLNVIEFTKSHWLETLKEYQTQGKPKSKKVIHGLYTVQENSLLYEYYIEHMMFLLEDQGYQAKLLEDA